MTRIKLSKTASHGYIYADGHAVIIHKEDHPKAGEVEWAEIWEKIDTHCNFEGRLVFHHPKYDGRLQLALNAYELRCTEPSLEGGSENTKRHNIQVQHFEIGSKDTRMTLSWTLFPELISDGITYQPEAKEVFSDLDGKYHWGMTRIDQVHRIEREPTAEGVAA